MGLHENAAAEPLIQASLLGEAIDPIPVLVFVADEQRRYVAVNQFAAEFLGYTRDELLRLRVSDVAPDADEDYELLIADGARRGEAELRRKDGTTARIRYVAAETKIAGMPLYAAVCFPL